MIRNLFVLIAVPLIAAACNKPSNPGDLGTTDPGNIGDDTGDTGSDCVALVQEISPDDGQANFYYRDDLEVLFTDAAEDIATFDLVDTDGTSHSLKAEFDASGMNAVVKALDPLSAGVSYTFTAGVCDDSQSVQFTTSVYGADLMVEPGDLIDLTYHFDLGGATYTKPAGIGFLIAQYLTDPLLVGVVDANADSLVLMGAQGWVNDSSQVKQDLNLNTFDFGSADFTNSPYFAADSTLVQIDYDDTIISMHEFHLEGTFEPDGSSIGGGMLIALIDTRNMGPLLDVADEPDAVCELADQYLGLDCEDCPDGLSYCIALEGTFDPAPVVDGLVLEVVVNDAEEG